MATQALYPFAPHLAEEVWEMMGCKEVLADQPYPTYRSQDVGRRNDHLRRASEWEGAWTVRAT